MPMTPIAIAAADIVAQTITKFQIELALFNEGLDCTVNAMMELKSNGIVTPETAERAIKSAENTPDMMQRISELHIIEPLLKIIIAELAKVG
jgi:hypothetical protein